MAKVRVYELAKELGVESKVVMAKLQELGEFVRSASSTVEPPVVRRLRETLPAELSAAKAARAPKGAGGRKADAASGSTTSAPRPERAKPAPRSQAAPPQAAVPSPVPETVREAPAVKAAPPAPVTPAPAERTSAPARPGPPWPPAHEAGGTVRTQRQDGTLAPCTSPPASATRGTAVPPRETSWPTHCNN